jgi:hypothetical protein
MLTLDRAGQEALLTRDDEDGTVTAAAPPATRPAPPPQAAALRPRHEVRSAWPRFGTDEVAAAAAVLASGKVNYWTGEEGRAFEREFAASSATVPFETAIA